MEIICVGLCFPVVVMGIAALGLWRIMLMEHTVHSLWLMLLWTLGLLAVIWFTGWLIGLAL